MRSILVLLMMALLPSILLGQVLDKKFDSRGHPKAKGAWVTVRYPGGWEAKEGERPNIVQKFSGNYKGYFSTLMLQILKADGPVENECKAMPTAEWAEIFTAGDSQSKASNIKKTVHEGKPAFMMDLRQVISRAGNDIEINQKYMTICYKNLMISAVCQAGKVDYKNQSFTTSKSILDEVQPLCTQFFNSLILMDSYSNAK